MPPSATTSSSPPDVLIAAAGSSTQCNACVLDATVGRNALAQEKIFGNQVGVSGIVMTKLDGTARGGVLVPVAQASDSPIKLIGVGEGIEDLQPFDARAFSRSLVGLESQ